MSDVPSTPRELMQLNSLWQLSTCKEFSHKVTNGRHTITVLLHSGKTITHTGTDVDVVSSHILVDVMESNREEADERDHYDSMLERLVQYAQKKKQTVVFSVIFALSSNPVLSPRAIRTADALLRVGKTEIQERFEHWTEERMKNALIQRAYSNLIEAPLPPPSSASSSKASK